MRNRAPIRLASLAIRIACPAVLSLAAANPAVARPGGWGSRDWHSGAWEDDRREGPGARGRGGFAGGPPEGQVIVSTFATEAPEGLALLRHGTVAVNGAPTGSGVPSLELAVYAAAVVDQLAQLGYRTDGPDSAANQIAELHITHATLVPEEVKKPVSGEVAVGVSNRGTAYGMAVNVDLTKPRAALIATTLEARIRDKASGKVLWEGRADINTREGDERWSAAAIAGKLAAGLFDPFPGPATPPA